MNRALFRNFRRAPLALLLFVFVLALLSAYGSSAGSPRKPRRIRQPVDDSNRTTLKGNTRREANAKNDRGRVADDLQIEHMLLQLRRSPEQEQALQQFLDQLHAPNSPNFHRWLNA